MFPEEFLDLAHGEQEDAYAWRCISCGEIIDQVIARNRIRRRDPRFGTKLKNPRHSIRTIPALL